MDKANFRLGYFYIFLCCLTNAVSFVFISHLNKTHDEMLSIFMTFGYAIIIFNLINFKNLSKIYSAVIHNKKVLFQMNLVTLFNWLSTFMSLHYLDPATALCLNLGVLSVTIFFISTPSHKLKANKHLGMSVLLVLFSMGLIIQQHLSTMPENFSLKYTAYGIAWCALGGFTGAFIGISSEAMGKAGFKVTQILATRFYLLTLISGAALLFTHHGIVIIDWKYYFFSSIIIVFFPLLMYQIAIRELGTLLVSLLEPFSPVFTYILQVAVGDYRFSALTISLLIFSCAAVVWFVRIEQRIQQKKYFQAE
jgi:drug/metabolite transporter (DMT)-like permease